MEKLENGSRGVSMMVLFLDVFFFFRGVLVLWPLLLHFAFACRWSIVGLRWLASLSGKAGHGIACSVFCITERLERRCFDVPPFLRIIEESYSYPSNGRFGQFMTDGLKLVGKLVGDLLIV